MTKQSNSFPEKFNLLKINRKKKIKMHLVITAGPSVVVFIFGFALKLHGVLSKITGFYIRSINYWKYRMNINIILFYFNC